MSKLLINEPPLQVLPTLAKWIGLNEAIVLQQLHYWLENPKIGKVADGRKWVRNSLREWQQENFPFWEERTVRRALLNLENDGLILIRSDLNQFKYDQTKWYAVEHDTINNLAGPVERIATRRKAGEAEGEATPQDCTPYQNSTPPQDCTPPLQKWGNGCGQHGVMDMDNMGVTIPETTQRLPETTTESEPPAPKKEKIDPLSHLLTFEKVSESSAPNPDDQYWQYRDEYLKAFQAAFGRYPSGVEKEEIVALAAQPLASPQTWAKAIRQSILNWSGNSRTPPLSRVIEVYEAGGDYELWRKKKYPDTRTQEKPDTPAPTIDRETYRKIHEQAQQEVYRG